MKKPLISTYNPRLIANGLDPWRVSLDPLAWHAVHFISPGSFSGNSRKPAAPWFFLQDALQF
jgi:hypothetical protein